MNHNDSPITAKDLQLATAELKAEFRAEMVTHIRWLTGLFIVQFIATVGATTALVNFVIGMRLP
jgi:hypothetical protein